MRRLLAILLVLFLCSPAFAQSEVRVIDGKKPPHVFRVAAGTTLEILTKGGATTILGTANANDFDWDGDGRANWSRLYSFGIVNASGASQDSLWYRTGGSLHATHLPAGITMTFAVEIDFNVVQASASDTDVVFKYKAVNGDADVICWGN